MLLMIQIVTNAPDVLQGSLKCSSYMTFYTKYKDSGYLIVI